jgi:uncharacterized repeat protein (TIGR01451 family)
VQAPDIDLTKVFANCAAGSTTTFTLTVRNVGNVATAGPILVLDQLPMTLTLVSIMAPGLWDCSASMGQLVSCSFPPPLAPTTAAPPIVVTVQVPPNAMVIVNEATAETAGDLVIATDRAMCRAAPIPAPALSWRGLALALLVLGTMAGLAIRRRRALLRE